MSSDVLTVMIDNCVLSLSETMRCVRKPVEVRFGDITQTVDVLGFAHRPGPGEHESWKREQFECLPTIARLAREGRIECYTYNELHHEAWRRPGSFPSDPIGRLFHDVTFHHVDAAVERSYFFQSDADEAVSHEAIRKFCIWLLDSPVDRHVDRLAENGRFPGALIDNLRRVHRFRELCAGLSEDQCVDAFHQWTAEVNGIDYFLTTDRKFINAQTKSKVIDLPSPPVGPAQLLHIQNVSNKDPFPHPDNGTIDILGNPL